MQHNLKADLGITGLFTEMERPQVIQRAGKYHMFFSCWLKMVAKSWVAQLITADPSIKSDLTDSALYHFVADHAQGPYQPANTPIVRGSGTLGLYGAMLVPRNNDQEFDVFGWHIKYKTLAIDDAYGVQWGVRGPRMFIREK